MLQRSFRTEYDISHGKQSSIYCDKIRLRYLPEPQPDNVIIAAPCRLPMNLTYVAPKTLYL